MKYNVVFSVLFIVFLLSTREPAGSLVKCPNNESVYYKAVALSML
jgi:hypothetical protein